MAEAPVQPRVTQAGSIQPVAIAAVGTVALLVAVLPEESFGTSFEEHKHSNASVVKY